jgi:hypothetical protein
MGAVTAKPAAHPLICGNASAVVGLDLSATQALTPLKSVRVVDIDLGDGTSKRSVTRGTQRTASVLRALGISDLNPPAPPKAGQTVM